MTVPAIRGRKKDGKTDQPLVMLTAYTMRMAQLLDPHCEMLLVGDSLGQVIYGLPSTVPVTMEMMCAHGAAVVRGSWHALVAVDMPFGSYEGSPEQAFASASRIMKETGCAAVKLEGGEAMASTIDFLTHRGIPVIGHVGLTPQAVNVLGGYGARGKNADEAKKIIGDAQAVAEAGAFCIVVEGVMEQIADQVADVVKVPIIGIGASPRCDGQVLVSAPGPDQRALDVPFHIELRPGRYVRHGARVRVLIPEASRLEPTTAEPGDLAPAAGAPSSSACAARSRPTAPAMR